MNIKVCIDCNVHADESFAVCPNCGKPIVNRRVLEIQTEHQLIRKLENAIYTDKPLPPVVIFSGKSDSAWGTE